MFEVVGGRGGAGQGRACCGLGLQGDPLQGLPQSKKLLNNKSKTEAETCPELGISETGAYVLCM